MCGIIALLNKTGKTADSSLLERMANAIHHRGPDENGVMVDGPVGFFHKRLSIIDLASGQQPMVFNNFTIIFNGEIYNYIELREELKKKGHSFHTTSDTEVILHLYAEYGENFVNLLNGMFAFIIYDKNQNRLFIARDHFGIKPLYWYRDNEIIAFGSEIKALLVHPRIKAVPDTNNLYEYLTFQFVMGESTMFQNISKVLPGHCISVNLDTWEFKNIKYWEPNFKVDQFHTEEYFIVELRHILEETISQQLRSDVPLGTYLSGGIDSSLVTIMASKFLDKPIKSFSGGFNEGPEFNELEYARIAAKTANAELFEIFPTEQEFIDILPTLIYHLDEPVAGPGLFPQYIVSKFASQHVKVILGGQGGDEIFGGYSRYMVAYLEQALKGAIFQSNEEDEHIVSLESILPNLPALKQYIPMMKSFWQEGSFEGMDRRYYHLINRMGATKEFFRKDFINECDSGAIFNKFSGYFNDPATKSYFNKMTHFDMLGSLPGLLQVEDRVSMSVSIESRVPLLDRRIVDLVSGMPAGMKFKGGEMKYLLKKTIKNIMPPEIMRRKDKMGFPVPLHLWSKNKAKGFIMDTLLSKKAKERNMIDTDHVEKLISSEQPFSRGLWGLLSLELWYNQFIDN
ncbi:MAG TPA: asparagine synthase (glutamine-hydrolyzing) [Hanamia sp.]|nr:asparagine synthase (glutamine-hydrolyzing) [Hanamia sp.]